MHLSRLLGTTKAINTLCNITTKKNHAVESPQKDLTAAQFEPRRQAVMMNLNYSMTAKDGTHPVSLCRSEMEDEAKIAGFRR